ncbi:MAG: SlyX family protein [Desulfobulbaceae bacterium]|nr:SlyX family protein [Desulfobulbaceae bacterium]
MSDERLIDIEIKIAFLEDTIQELNTVVCEQQKQIDRLEATCNFLLKRVKILSEATGDNIPNEKPPHY